MLLAVRQHGIQGLWQNAAFVWCIYLISRIQQIFVHCHRFPLTFIIICPVPLHKRFWISCPAVTDYWIIVAFPAALFVASAENTLPYIKCTIFWWGNVGDILLVTSWGKAQGICNGIVEIIITYLQRYGLDNLLLTCDKGNTFSSRTILNNGGILENKVADSVGLSKTGVIQRYWITL